MWHAPATRRSNRTILADAPALDKFEAAPDLLEPSVIIEIPAGKDPLTYARGELVPGIGPAAAAFSAAVYAHRLNRVTGLDEVCTLPPHVPGTRA